MRLAERDRTASAGLVLTVAQDSVGEFRVLVSGRADTIPSDGQPINFVLAHADSGARTVYRSVFLGSAATRQGEQGYVREVRRMWDAAANEHMRKPTAA